MELPELPKIPEGAKKYVPYVAVGGVVLAAVVLSRRGGGTASTVQAPASPTGAPTPTNPFSSSALAGSTGSVGSLPAQQVTPQTDEFAETVKRFDAFYLPLGYGGTAQAGASAGSATGLSGSGLSRFDFYNQSVAKKQSSEVELAAKQTQIQQNAQLAVQKQQADLAQKAKDRDENIFRNPSNFLKGIGSVGNSLKKVFSF